MVSVLLEAYDIVNEYLESIGDKVLVENGVIRSFNRLAAYASERKVRGVIGPGIVDAHLHIAWIGLSLEGSDLSGARSPEEVGRLLANSSGFFAYGRGWDQEKFTNPSKLPDRRVLDKYVPDRPAVAVRVCGHLAVANTQALNISKIHEKYPQFVDLKEGIVREDAVYHLVDTLLNKVNVSTYVERAVNIIKNNGIVGVSSMACPPNEARSLYSLSLKKKLPLKVACYPRIQDLELTINLLNYNNNVEVVGIKEFADGSLGARTAFLSDDYYDDPGNRGILLLNSNDIIKIGEKVIEKGLRIAIHAIGDAAIKEVLHAYEYLQPGDRGRIEHASIIPPGLEGSIASLGIYTVVQPHFRVSDWWIDKRLGQARLAWAYPFKRLVDSNVKLALSTDSPVEPLSPTETFRAALSKCRQPSCNREEALTPKEAFYAYTRGAALASGGPVSKLATLEEESPACFNVYGEDPRKGSLRIKETILLGC